MILLDTNIFIYIAGSFMSPDVIDGHDIAHSSVTRLEAMGFPDIRAGEVTQLARLFTISGEYDVSQQIVDRAITIRQIRRMELGDAIIAATALEHDLELWTHNTRDFSWIDGLRLHDPVG